MGDELDDILNSALDEVEREDDAPAGKVKLSEAARKAADASAEAARKAEEDAAAASKSSGGMGGFDEASMEEMLKQLEDPNFAKTLEETLKLMSNDPSALSGAGGEDDAELASTLQALAEAAKGLEGASASQAEEMGEKIMSEMMKQFESMGSKEDFQGIMDGMLKQLLSKDIMYAPTKQITERFPEWLADNQSKLPKEEYERYGRQYQYYQRILEVYETEPDNFSRLSELMQEIQECGQPPAEIIKELAPGLEMSPDGVPQLPGLGAGGMPPLPPGLDPKQMEQIGANCAQQ